MGCTCSVCCASVAQEARCAFMHSLFDTDSKGFLSEDELGALLEVLCDVVEKTDVSYH